MMFEGVPIPASLVQIMNITKKDGSPLEPDNWRQKNIGIVTMCTLAGGFKRLTPVFQMKVQMENGEVSDVDLHWSGNAWHQYSMLPDAFHRFLHLFIIQYLKRVSFELMQF